MKTLRKKLAEKVEKLAANYIKVRDKFTCQKCGKHLEKNNCHASHVIPRSAGNQFRFDPLNLKTLCFHCHINWWHKNPVEASEWFKEKFPDRYEYLFGQMRKTVKFSTADYEILIEDLNLKLKQFE